MAIQTHLQALQDKYDVAVKEGDWSKSMLIAIEIMQERSRKNPRNFPGQPEYKEHAFRMSRLDSWNIEESVNLLCHCFSNRDEFVHGHDHLNAQIKGIKTLIQTSVGVSLFPVNPDEPPKKYRFQPQDIIDWARQKEIDVPLSLLEIFDVGAGKQINPNVFRNAEKRDEVFAAAFALLSEYREECVAKSSNRVVIKRLLNLMEQKAPEFWPDEGEPPLSRSTIEKYLTQWINKVKKSKK